MARIDIKQVASAALPQADSLVRAWLPGGKRTGSEYVALNPLRADSSKKSFSINLDTGLWADFATDAKGGDLVSLYAYLHGLDQLAAAKDVAEQIGYELPTAKTRKAKQTIKAVRTVWTPVLPAPASAPPPPAAHYARGKPAMVWTYRDQDDRVLGYVYRFPTSDGGKETLPVTWCRNADTDAEEWRWMAFPEPRPLYGLDRLVGIADQRPVLLVEGEKCADAAVQLLPELAIVSWPGGSKAIGKVDWAPLLGRNIFAWADCDAQREPLSKAEKDHGIDPLSKPLLPEDKQPGMRAMLEIGRRLVEADPTTRFRLVTIPAPGEKPGGWDIADAMAEGLDADGLKAFIRNVRPLPSAAAADSAPPPPDSEQGWSARDLHWKKGEIVSCITNVFDILTHDPAWEGVLAYNEFTMQTVKRKPPPYPGGAVGEWDDRDDVHTAMWITRQYGFAPTPSLTAEGAETAAKERRFHPLQDYIRALTWDGTPRREEWLQDYFGVPKTDYSTRVARFFLGGMVARAMQPGVKFDYCLVLEGEQGRKKSSALKVLGGEYFADTDLDLGNKDSMVALAGKWVYEIAELGALAKAETSRQKSFLSRQVDEFRPHYGRRQIKCPRQVVFGGSTNEWEWNKDPTGGRRFWPLYCAAEIDLDGLAAARDQLIAEAFVAWQGGERFWPTSDEQREIFDPEQLKRQHADAYIDMLESWIDKQYMEFSLADAAVDGLKLDASKLTRDVQTRIGYALRQLGCSRVERRNGTIRFWYKPPERKRASSTAGSQQDGGSYGIPF